MYAEMPPRRLFLSALVSAFTLLPPTLGLAQDRQANSRFRVLIPALAQADGDSRDLGRDVAEELRDMVDGLVTHRSVDNDEFEDALDRFDLPKDELTCIQARQVALRMEAVAIVFCIDVHPASAEDVHPLTVRFLAVESGDESTIPEFMVNRREASTGASHVYEAFESLVEQLRYARFCTGLSEDALGESNLGHCDRAIELNPRSVSSLYARGMIHVRTERWSAALEDFETILAIEPLHDAALKAAGYASANAGEADKAIDYYRRFLDLNPGDAQVRMNIAYEAATAGEPGTALELINEGLEIDETNEDLWLQKAGYAMASAERLYRDNDNALTDQAAALYRDAIEAYGRVGAGGEEARVGHRRSVITAYQRLGQLDQALSSADDALTTWPDVAQLWSVRADVLQRLERVDEALESLQKTAELDPAYRNVWARMGSWLLQADRDEEAIEALGKSVERGEQSMARVASILFASGYREGIGTEDWPKAVRRFRSAEGFAAGTEEETRVRFWLGYGLLKHGQVLEAPQTLETARRTQPMFAEALSRFEASREYSEVAGQLPNLIDAARQYLAIQEAIIERGPA